MTAFCAQNSFINANSDVFMGLAAWGAGSFTTSYILSLTPANQNGRLVDSTLMKQCLLDTWNDGSSNNGTIPTRTSATNDPTGVVSSTFLIVTSTLLSTPSALLTATFTLPTFSVPNNSSRPTSKSTINTSNVLILTGILTQSTIPTLAIATGSPPARSGFAGLLTAQSVPPQVPTQTPTSTTTPTPTPANGADSLAATTLTLWSLLIIAAVSLI